MLQTWYLNDTSPAAPGTVVSTAAVQGAPATGMFPAGVIGPLSDGDALDIVASLKGATGGTLDVYVQKSPDGIVWTDCVHFAQLAAGAAAVVYSTSVTHLAQPTSAAPVVVGQGTSPALAVATAVQGGWGDRIRLVFVAGSSTSAGAAVQIQATVQRSGGLNYAN